MRFRSYVVVVLGSLLALTGTVVLLNWLVDPLDVFRVVRAEGFNSVKPSYTPYARLAKPAQVARGDYQRLALGSSRVLMGIPMQGSAWAADGTPGFNLGLNGADLRTVREVLEHAIVQGDVKSVVISVDLFMFNAWKGAGRYPYAIATLDETPEQRFVRQRDTALNLLFSPGITVATFDTLRKQREKYDKMRIDGSSNADHDLRQALRDGYEVRFTQFEDRIVRTGWSPCRDNRFSFQARQVDTLRIFREILQLTHQHGIRVDFFISPLHSRMLEMMQAAGLGDDFDGLKRQLLAEIVARYGEAMPGVSLWDFSGYHAYAREPLPAKPDVPMQWYTDASHFSQALGILMLDTMFGTVPPDPAFGVALRPDTIDAALEQWHKQRAAFLLEDAALVADLHARTAAILREKQTQGNECLEPVIDAE